MTLGWFGCENLDLGTVELVRILQAFDDACDSCVTCLTCVESGLVFFVHSACVQLQTFPI